MTGPRPGDLVGAARVVRGPDWIVNRAREFYQSGVTWETRWWLDALTDMDRTLRTHGLAPSPVVARVLRFDERHWDVTLYVETRAAGGPMGTWGLPRPVLTLTAGLPACPPGGDFLLLPSFPGGGEAGRVAPSTHHTTTGRDHPHDTSHAARHPGRDHWA